MADKVFTVVDLSGEGVYRNSKTDFQVNYIKKKEMKNRYPGGGYSVVGQIGKGKDEIGSLTSGDNTEKVYKVNNSVFRGVKGYVPVGENTYIAVAYNTLLLWLLLCLLVAALIVGIIFFVKSMPTSAEGETTTSINLEQNAILGEGEISIPDKTDTKGAQIQLPGLTELRFVAGQTEQNQTLYNPESNPCFFQIEIELTDTGEIIYTSGLLAPGYSIQQFNIEHAMSAGTYNVAVHYNAYSFDQEMRKLNNGVIKTTLYVE